METETSVGSSITAPSIGGGIESSFSFANTAPLNAPSEVSLGGTFDPGFTSFNKGEFQSINFLDSSLIAQNDSGVTAEIPDIFNQEFAGINLDPDLPGYVVPQAFQNAFSGQDLLDPPQFSEQINIIGIPVETSKNPIIEQINYSFEPEIVKTEAEMAEIFGEPLTAPKLEILDRKIEEFTEEVQELTAQTPVIPSEVEDQAWESTKVVEDCHVTDVPRNDNTKPVTVSEVVMESMQTDEQVHSQVYPEIVQAETTYESLIVAGIPETQAEELTQNALVLAGVEPEIAKQTMVQIRTGTKTKSHAEFKTQSQASLISASDKILKQVQNDETFEIEKELEIMEVLQEEPAAAEAMTSKKFKEKIIVVDKEALEARSEALKYVVGNIPSESDKGDDIIDSNKAAALMPTEVQNQGVISGILSKSFIEMLNLGDGSYRTWVSSLKGLGVISRWEFLKAGLEINRKYYPVTAAEVGEQAEESAIVLVLDHKPDLIRHLRK